LGYLGDDTDHTTGQEKISWPEIELTCQLNLEEEYKNMVAQARISRSSTFTQTEYTSYFQQEAVLAQQKRALEDCNELKNVIAKTETMIREELGQALDSHLRTLSTRAMGHLEFTKQDYKDKLERLRAACSTMVANEVAIIQSAEKARSEKAINSLKRDLTTATQLAQTEKLKLAHRVVELEESLKHHKKVAADANQKLQIARDREARNARVASHQAKAMDSEPGHMDRRGQSGYSESYGRPESAPARSMHGSRPWFMRQKQSLFYSLPRAGEDFAEVEEAVKHSEFNASNPAQGFCVSCASQLPPMCMECDPKTFLVKKEEQKGGSRFGGAFQMSAHSAGFGEAQELERVDPRSLWKTIDVGIQTEETGGKAARLAGLGEADDDWDDLNESQKDVRYLAKLENLEFTQLMPESASSLPIQAAKAAAAWAAAPPAPPLPPPPPAPAASPSAAVPPRPPPRPAPASDVPGAGAGAGAGAGQSDGGDGDPTPITERLKYKLVAALSEEDITTAISLLFEERRPKGERKKAVTKESPRKDREKSPAKKKSRDGRKSPRESRSKTPTSDGDKDKKSETKSSKDKGDVGKDEEKQEGEETGNKDGGQDRERERERDHPQAGFGPKSAVSVWSEDDDRVKVLQAQMMQKEMTARAIKTQMAQQLVDTEKKAQEALAQAQEVQTELDEARKELAMAEDQKYKTMVKISLMQGEIDKLRKGLRPRKKKVVRRDPSDLSSSDDDDGQTGPTPAGGGGSGGQVTDAKARPSGGDGRRSGGSGAASEAYGADEQEDDDNDMLGPVAVGFSSEVYEIKSDRGDPMGSDKVLDPLFGGPPREAAGSSPESRSKSPYASRRTSSRGHAAITHIMPATQAVAVQKSDNLFKQGPGRFVTHLIRPASAGARSTDEEESKKVRFQHLPPGFTRETQGHRDMEAGWGSPRNTADIFDQDGLVAADEQFATTETPAVIPHTAAQAFEMSARTRHMRHRPQSASSDRLLAARISARPPEYGYQTHGGSVYHSLKPEIPYKLDHSPPPTPSRQPYQHPVKGIVATHSADSGSPVTRVTLMERPKRAPAATTPRMRPATARERPKPPPTFRAPPSPRPAAPPSATPSDGPRLAATTTPSGVSPFRPWGVGETTPTDSGMVPGDGRGIHSTDIPVGQFVKYDRGTRTEDVQPQVPAARPRPTTARPNLSRS